MNNKKFPIYSSIIFIYSFLFFSNCATTNEESIKPKDKESQKENQIIKTVNENDPSNEGDKENENVKNVRKKNK